MMKLALPCGEWERPQDMVYHGQTLTFRALPFSASLWAKPLALSFDKAVCLLYLPLCLGGASQQQQQPAVGVFYCPHYNLWAYNYKKKEAGLALSKKKNPNHKTYTTSKSKIQNNYYILGDHFSPGILGFIFPGLY